MSKRQVVLECKLSLGDIVMLTASVRDLYKAMEGEIMIAVRTTCAELWENNPYVVQEDDLTTTPEVVQCGYPLIHSSNQLPYHFIHGFRKFLQEQLALSIPATAFHGDLHLSAEERGWMSQVEEALGLGARYWIIVSGGKYDFTTKWWLAERFQEVVDRLSAEITFVQVGLAEHHHPRLRGALDLVGRTSIRQLVRLVYNCDGVVCPVTGIMHLAAAVPAKEQGMHGRPCVVIAGGREPPHWEAYPQHRFLHTVGALHCCSQGGCWRSRTTRLGDGDEKDDEHSLCVSVTEGYPDCMRLISTDMVVRAIELYYEGDRLP